MESRRAQCFVSDKQCFGVMCVYSYEEAASKFYSNIQIIFDDVEMSSGRKKEKEAVGKIMKIMN